VKQKLQAESKEHACADPGEGGVPHPLASPVPVHNALYRKALVFRGGIFSKNILLTQITSA
jgi:hypothetical protein